jgi:hypothetical protein
MAGGLREVGRSGHAAAEAGGGPYSFFVVGPVKRRWSFFVRWGSNYGFAYCRIRLAILESSRLATQCSRMVCVMFRWETFLVGAVANAAAEPRRARGRTSAIKTFIVRSAYRFGVRLEMSQVGVVRELLLFDCCLVGQGG